MVTYHKYTERKSCVNLQDLPKKKSKYKNSTYRKLHAPLAPSQISRIEFIVLPQPKDGLPFYHRQIVMYVADVNIDLIPCTYIDC